jgi:FAD/FMN-containing dehydrogenase
MPRLITCTLAALALALLCACGAPNPAADRKLVNDVMQLNPVQTAGVETPHTTEEVAALVSSHDGPISIGGGRFSQGGQTGCTQCLFIDMRGMNKIIAIDEANRTITVQAGATWRQIQEAVDPLDLSPAIMQSFSNFTVGGSLSVNCHGDYAGHGPIVESVRSIEIVLADGSIVTASRTQNRDIFRAAIGGYGGIGVITQATLDLAVNTRLERRTLRMDIDAYPAWHRENVLGHPDIILHHAVIYPRGYRDVSAEISTITDKPLTITDRLTPAGQPDRTNQFLVWAASTPWGRFIRENVYDPHSGRTVVAMRNHEAAKDAIYELEPASRARSTYVLQEYFVPVDRFAPFVANMGRILNEHDANVLNIAIRHTRADDVTMLAWARNEVYSFVLYYEQGTSEEARAAVGAWTRELVDAAIAEGGAYYLPYQIHATREQFLAAYPQAPAYFALKRRLDPTYKFRNRLWEAYYTPIPADAPR